MRKISSFIIKNEKNPFKMSDIIKLNLNYPRQFIKISRKMKDAKKFEFQVKKVWLQVAKVEL